MENKGNRFDVSTLGRPESVTEKAKDLGSQMADAARDVGSQAAEKARDVAAQAAEKARNVAASVSEEASRVGHQVSDAYEASREYVHDRGLSGMAEDVTNLIRRNPMPALLISFGIGFLVARALRED